MFRKAIWMAFALLSIPFYALAAYWLFDYLAGNPEAFVNLIMALVMATVLGAASYRVRTETTAAA